MDASLQISGCNIIKGTLIGKGNFGEVYKCIWKIPNAGKLSQITVAVKYTIPCHDLDSKFIAEAQKEFNILSKLEHENIVQVYGYFVENNQFAIVMEYIEHVQEYRNNLHQLLLHLEFGTSLETQINWMQQATKAVHYLHSQKIIHRDIKSLNFLVNKNKQLKICDFGLAKYINSTSIFTKKEQLEQCDGWRLKY